MKALLFLAIVGVLAGCAENPGPNPATEAKRMENAQNIRSLFDKAHGDYTKLSSADRQLFIQAVGGDSGKAESAWNAMKYGSAAAPKAKGGQ